jgi:hypothetical protein
MAITPRRVALAVYALEEIMITKTHYAAWIIAALSGGALACESAPARARAPRPTSTAVFETRAGFTVEHFRHNGNDCYVRGADAIACVRAEVQP